MAAAAAPPPGERIPYDIVYCSSEDEPFPVTELLRSDDTPGHRGWQTAKNPKYPQSLVLRFPGDVELHQIQILSHECKIASKVEVRVFSLVENGFHDEGNDNMPSFRDARFVKLGSVGFNSNEKSKYRSKERKTVHLKSVAYFLKLNFHKCHTNNLNSAQQVGIYSVACYGFPATVAQWHVDHPILPPETHQGVISPVMSDEGGGLPPIQRLPAVRQPPAQQPQLPVNTTPALQQYYPQSDEYYAPTPVPNAPSPAPQSGKLPPINPRMFRSPPEKHNTAHPHDVPTIPDPVAMGNGSYVYRSQRILDFDVFYYRRTEELVRLKAEAVDMEDFDAAKEYKDLLQSLHQNAAIVYELEKEKVKFIYDEDFDGAKRVKGDMDDRLEAMYGSVPGGVERYLGEGTTVPVGPPAPQGKKQNPVGGSSKKGNVVELPPVVREKKAGVAGKNKFEDEPVRSKYAIAMAQRREENPSDDEAEGDPQSQDERADDNGPQAEEQTPKRTMHNTSAPPDAPTTAATADEATDAPAVIDEFDYNTLPKWEQAVFKAVHAEAQEDAPAQPIASGTYTEAAECIRNLGNYMTACLLSKRWKLREAAIRVISSQVLQLYQQANIGNIMYVVLKFLDVRGWGLQDTIGNVFLACCELVQNVLADKYDCRYHVLPAALNLLPRFIARAGDAAQKTREESQATVLAYVACPEVGVNYVANIVLADPIDQDKRRISAQNHRIQLARLSLLQNLLNQFKLTLSPAMFDTCMVKLLVPCLNHSSNEVRDQATLIANVLIDTSYDITKYLPSVSNAAIKSALSSALDGKRPKRGSSAGNKRNTSAPRKREASAKGAPAKQEVVAEPE